MQALRKLAAKKKAAATKKSAAAAAAAAEAKKRAGKKGKVKDKSTFNQVRPAAMTLHLLQHHLAALQDFSFEHWVPLIVKCTDVCFETSLPKLIICREHL